MWFFSTDTSGYAYGLFGQCDTAATDKSLHYIIRSSLFLLGFYADDLQSLTTIQINTWYHVAFVYDYSSSTQYIYRDGMLDGQRTSKSPYQGMSGSIDIGKVEIVPGGSYYFYG